MREIDLSRPLPFIRYLTTDAVADTFSDLIPAGYVARIRNIYGQGSNGLTVVVYVYDRFNSKVKALATLKEVISGLYIFPNADSFELGFINPQDTIKINAESGFNVSIQFELFRAF